MKVKRNNKQQDFQSIWFDARGKINVIDQRKLPFSFKIVQTKNIEETCFIIKEMVVRGAPLIGMTAVYGLLQSALLNKEKNFDAFHSEVIKAAKKLEQTRPTAVDLFNAINMILAKVNPEISVMENVENIYIECEKYKEKIIAECLAIGMEGNKLVPSKGANIMTICNAGALATVDVGTALAPIRKAHQDGKKIIVYVNETRPLLQGARLTSWELTNEEIEHYIIVDNAAGYLIGKGKIDLVIVGADRITQKGDIANKIGTYTLSVLCKEHKVPFYVAAPFSTFDKKTKEGKEIIIEERNEMEMKTAFSINNEKDKEGKRRLIYNTQAKTLNPAFDVTPAKNITGIITAKGILYNPLKKAIREYLAQY